ncbi:MAG: hypothetical protein WC710_13560 [Gallionella sp.]|jgi:hypothetical protein
MNSPVIEVTEGDVKAAEAAWARWCSTYNSTRAALESFAARLSERATDEPTDEVVEAMRAAYRNSVLSHADLYTIGLREAYKAANLWRLKEFASADRGLLVEIARLWPGHDGVNYETTTSENLLLLIRDAAQGDREKLGEFRADYQACRDAGFESPGELLAAYNHLKIIADHQSCRVAAQAQVITTAQTGPWLVTNETRSFINVYRHFDLAEFAAQHPDKGERTIWQHVDTWKTKVVKVEK